MMPALARGIACVPFGLAILWPALLGDARGLFVSLVGALSAAMIVRILRPVGEPM